MTNFNKSQKLAMIALPLGIMLNPLVISIYIYYVTLVLQAIGTICLVYIVVFLLAKVFQTERVNIPAKTAKTTKAGKFIVT